MGDRDWYWAVVNWPGTPADPCYTVRVPLPFWWEAVAAVGLLVLVVVRLAGRKRNRG